tara:strand:+ start:259 stop:1041 length:783 start_codon:yes stop_codon:yes gene_type:complete
MIRSLFYKIINKIRKAILWISYDYENLLKKQIILYGEIDLDRINAEKIIKKKYKEFPEITDLASEHHLLFSAVSLKNDTETILEIGTYTGSCTKLFSILFPQSKICTIDLPDDDPLFGGTYDRNSEEKLSHFIKKRNALINSCKNVQFLQKNSLELYKTDDKFDLIWVDGAHGYPVVAMDIINSLGCLSKNGRMFIDDVWTNRKTNDPHYKSIGAYESLISLKHAGLVEFFLIPKRIEFPHGKGHLKKYIAYVKHSKNYD